MSSSVHIDNKGKDIFILGKGPTQNIILILHNNEKDLY